MKKEQILSILNRIDCDEHTIRLTSSEPLPNGATLTHFDVDIEEGCGPTNTITAACIHFEGDEQHLYSPIDWEGFCVVESIEDLKEIPWVDQDFHEAPLVDGLPVPSK